MKQKVKQKNKHIMKVDIHSCHYDEVRKVISIRFSFDSEVHNITVSASKIRYTRTGIKSYIETYIRKYTETSK